MLWVPPNIFVISLLDVTIDLYTDSTGSSGGVVYSTASSRQSVVYYTRYYYRCPCVRSFISGRMENDAPEEGQKCRADVEVAVCVLRSSGIPRISSISRRSN